MDSDIFCKGFPCGKKDKMSNLNLCRLFTGHIATDHSDHNHIFTDGSKDADNVGCATISGVETLSRKLNPQSTIFTAELYAILDAMNFIDSSDTTNHTIFSDSQSAIQAIQLYNNNHPIVMEINTWLIRLSSRHKIIRLCWVPSHIGIPGNEAADTAAKAASTSDNAIDYPNIPHKDYYPLFKKTLKNCWQETWSNTADNKLRQIKETIKPWPSSAQKVRKHERVLARLRIGHTRLTHGYLMERGRPPYCDDCLVPLTVKHMLAECPSYRAERIRWFPRVALLRDADDILIEILAENNATNFHTPSVIGYLTQLGVLDKI
jgi:kelch-like protein 2/3